MKFAFGFALEKRHPVISTEGPCNGPKRPVISTEVPTCRDEVEKSI